MSPSNGLLLCATHHALFDAHVLTVAQDLRITHFPSDGPPLKRDSADAQVVVALNGKSIALPTDVRLHPSPDALRFRSNMR